MASAASSGAPAEVSSSTGIDAIIAKLLEVRGSRPGKQVNLTEAEIRDLCTSARDIFMNQPVLLELEAPIKICGAPADTSIRGCTCCQRCAGRVTPFSACLPACCAPLQRRPPLCIRVHARQRPA